MLLMLRTFPASLYRYSGKAWESHLKKSNGVCIAASRQVALSGMDRRRESSYLQGMRKILIAFFTAVFALASPASAQEKKQPAEAALAKDKLSIEERKRIDSRLLDNLMARLHRSTSEQQAKAIEHTIQQLWLRNYSPSVEVLMKQAITAMNEEQYAPALTLLDTVIELAPDYAEAWNKRATAYFYERDYERSLADIEQVLQLEPRHFGALTGRALVQRARGNKKEALQAFREALEIHPFLEGAKSGVKALQKDVEGERI